MSMPATILNQSRSDTVSLFEELQQDPTLTIDLLPIKKGKRYKTNNSVVCGSQTAYIEAEKLCVLLPFAIKPTPSTSEVTAKDDQLTLAILSWYATLCSNQMQHFTSKEQAMRFFFTLENGANYSETFIIGKNFTEEYVYLNNKGHVRPSGLGGLIGGDYFSNANRDLKASLAKQIGQSHMSRYVPSEIGKEKGDSATTKGHTFYGLDIKPHNITIVNQPR